MSVSLKNTRKEVLRLYKDILRTCRRFTYTDEKGQPWYSTQKWGDLRTRSKVLKESARKEIENAKHDTDVAQILEKIVAAREGMVKITEMVFLLHLGHYLQFEAKRQQLLQEKKAM